MTATVPDGLSALAPRRRLHVPGWVVAVWVAATWIGALAGSRNATAASDSAAGAHLVLWLSGAAVVAIGGALSGRRWLSVGAALVVSCGAAFVLGARAESGRVAPAPAAIDGVATLVGDPEWRSGDLRVDVRIDGRRYELWARGQAAWSSSPPLERGAAGERWRVRGAVRPADGDWLRPRHIGARISAADVRRVDEGWAPFRAANGLRALIGRSGASLSPRDRALLSGFVFGDDRGQLPEVVDDFRASGLTHLLAVSGQNVAFVLAALTPVLKRLSPSARVVVIGCVLAEFCLATRWEPSVLRACALAMAAVGLRAVGRPVAAGRLLGAVVSLLLLIDPLLSWSVGFALSVAASAAIVILSEPIENVLPGPRWFATPLAVTVAAQIGVLPIQVAIFGSLPLVSVPANLAAGPAAGPVMVWGSGAGLVGGLAGEPVAALLHLPTRVLLWWVAGVARVAAQVGGPSIDARGAIVGLVLVALAGLAGLAGRARLLVGVGAIVAAAFASVGGAPASVVVGERDQVMIVGAQTASVVVVVDRPDPAAALQLLRVLDVAEIDVLIARSSSALGAEAVRAIRARHAVGEVIAPRRFTPAIAHRGLGGTVRVATSAGELAVTGGERRLDVVTLFDVPSRR